MSTWTLRILATTAGTAAVFAGLAVLDFQPQLLLVAALAIVASLIVWHLRDHDDELVAGWDPAQVSRSLTTGVTDHRVASLATRLQIASRDGEAADALAADLHAQLVRVIAGQTEHGVGRAALERDGLTAHLPGDLADFVTATPERTILTRLPAVLDRIESR